jgi:hypothetical protein
MRRNEMRWKMIVADGIQGNVEFIVSAESLHDAIDAAYEEGLNNGYDCIENIMLVERLDDTD